MDRCELKKWATKILDNKGRSSLNANIRNSKIVQNYILLETDYLINNETFSERIFHIANNYFSTPICPICQINKLKFNPNKWDYNKSCSIKCGANHPERSIKTITTNLEKYGVENVYQSKEVKQKIKETNLRNIGFEYYTQTKKFKEHCRKLNLEKYGVENYSQTQEFKDKVKSTSLEKYGVEHVTQSQEFKDRLKETNLKKYGVDHQFKDPYIRKKISNTIKEKYGKDWYTETEEFKKKFKEYSLLKYGTEYPSTNRNVKIKKENTCINKYQFKSYLGSKEHKEFMLKKWGIEYPFHGKYKDYILPSGRIVKIQGYENYALDLLLKTYKEEDLLIVDKEIRNRLGKILYFDPYADKERQYLLDIYLIPENRVIEVKSEFTFMRNLEINLIKRESCISKGFGYEFWVFNNKNELTII
jgi:hypothetical protein